MAAKRAVKQKQEAEENKANEALRRKSGKVHLARPFSKSPLRSGWTEDAVDGGLGRGLART